jgi:uncharacterized membrane protein
LNEKKPEKVALRSCVVRPGWPPRWLLAALAAVPIGLLATGAARAEFQVCNQTLDVVNVAIGQQQTDVFRTEGWWTIGSNQCAKVIKGDLQNRYIYVFASDVFGQTLLEGTVPMCIDEDKFSIDGTESCWRRGYRQAKFVEVDTQAVDNWTLFLNQSDE